MGLLTLMMTLVMAGGSLGLTALSNSNGSGGTGDNKDDKYDCLRPCSIDDPDCVCGEKDDDGK
jgi:hypothetical protein